MKKIRVFLVLLFSMIIVSGCSCTQSMCTGEDLDAIKASITEKYKGDQTNLYDTTYEISLREEAISKGISNETEIENYVKQNIEKKIENEYNSHPKACLTIEDSVDPDSGAKISGKTWKSAFTEGGLLEGLIVYPISWLLITFVSLFGSSGGAKVLSIIVTTLLIKLVMLLSTFKSQIQAQKIQEIQPELNAITQKIQDPNISPNEKARLQMKMFEIYKKHDIKPLAGMLPQILSIPIFLSVWSAVSQTLVIRNGSFLGIDLGVAVSSQVFGLNIGAIVLFLLMTGFQILSMKLPNIIRKIKADYKTKDKVQNMEGQMKTMMNFLLITIIFTGFMLPAALAIYWTIGAIFAILQTLVFQSDAVKSKLNGLASRKKKAKVVK